MSMKPLEFDRRYGELDQVISAYAGQVAETERRQRDQRHEPPHPDRFLDAYLRHTWHTRPWALSIAEQQLREYARNPPGRVRHRLGEFYAIPDVGLPQADIQTWLFQLADRIKQSIAGGEVPPPSAPQTHWEWHARFPELSQFLGGWFSQDMPEEFADHDAAVRDYDAATDRNLVARLVGEIHELLALDLDESDYAVAVAELGMEVDPPVSYALSAWLALVAELLSGPRTDYGE
ncbi:contact-dependent growth inhibition system immunity protein [Streptomyces scopuliridis]|uniref:contact-dependent growth inhibition system immunity protein n=1 Tax=Streptomyces scopuliridis TaxID=452529 RepID=UPI00342E1290